MSLNAQDLVIALGASWRQQCTQSISFLAGLEKPYAQPILCKQKALLTLAPFTRAITTMIIVSFASTASMHAALQYMQGILSMSCLYGLMERHCAFASNDAGQATNYRGSSSHSCPWTYSSFAYASRTVQLCDMWFPR